MKWSEPLPVECPPKTALTTEGCTVYRIALNKPPNEDDFKSHREKYPAKFFSVGECQARSLSVYDSQEQATLTKKLPIFKDKETIIAKLVLTKDDGLIMKTSGPGHYSWWRTEQYDIATAIEL